VFNSEPAEYLYGLDPLPFWKELFLINFEDIKMKILRKSANSRQYRASSDCTNVHAGLALYW
jgi:hypothetical protein